MEKMPFGLLLRKLRIACGSGLRAFAHEIGMKPSNLSFIESGRDNPPRSPITLSKIAHALKLKKGSKEWGYFFDAAVDDTPGRLPADILSNRTICDQVPIMLRTVANAKLSVAELKTLVARIKEYRPQKREAK